MRGTESDHILVLIDGVRASSATLGTFAWSQFSPDQIERIEIVRGPRSSLYGSDAIGGVIQIFTRQAKDTRIKLSAGSHRTREVSVSTGGGKDWKYSIEAGYQDTDGIPTNIIFTDDHGFNQGHAALNLTGNLNPANQLKFNFSHNDGKNELVANADEMSIVKIYEWTGKEWDIKIVYNTPPGDWVWAMDFGNVDND